MRFTTKTEYGIICLLYLARRGAGRAVTIKEIAKDERFSPAYTEKILQALKNAGILESHQGNQGGYVLARAAADISLKDIVEALEGHTFDVFCAPDRREEITCTHFSLCSVKPIWRETKGLLDRFYDSITLEDMAAGKLDFKERAA